MKSLKTYYFISLILSLCSIGVQGQEPAWELISMTPPRGTIMEINYVSPNSIFTYSKPGIIFHSTNGGCSWNQINHGYKLTGIVCQNNSIFSRTLVHFDSVGYGNIDSFLVIKSTDFGVTWKKITGPWDNKLPSQDLIKDGNRIYVSVLLKSSDKQIYYTTNEGENWQFCCDLKIRPGDSISQYEPNTFVNLFIRGDIFIATAFPVYGNGMYLFLSNDTGKTWKMKFITDQTYHAVINSEQEIYISTSNGIWLSNDFGNSWVNKWLTGNEVANFSLSNDKTKIIASIIGMGIKYSIDGGANWNFSNEFTDLKPLYSWINTKYYYEGSKLCAPVFLGSYLSDDNGESWKERNNGYSTVSPEDFVIIDKEQSYFLSHGIFKYSMINNNYEYLGHRNDWMDCIAFNSKKHIFVGSSYNGAFRSTDAGQTWTPLFDDQIVPEAIIINKRDVIFSSTLGVVRRSTDNGDTWTQMPVFGRCLSTNDEGDVFSFSYANPTSHPAYGIHRTTDDGVTWDSVGGWGLDYPDGTIEEPTVRITFNKKTKTAWFGSLIDNQHTFWGIFKTINNGRSWEPINFNNSERDWFPSGEVVAVDSLGCWVAARGGEKFGIYRSCDNGETWQRMDTSGLKHSDFGPVAVSPDGHIYVFGNTGGLYRSRDAFVSVEEGNKQQANNMTLLNSPNPFSEMTEVTYFLPEAANIKLAVYDILGIECAVLAESWQQAGSHTAQFSANDYRFASGIYYYRLDAAGKSITSQMVVVR